MQTITVERTIAAPQDAVFDFMSNAANFTRSPLVVRQRLAEPGLQAPYGQGAVRILLWTIGWFRERITAYDAPHSFDYSVERSFLPSEHRHGRGRLRRGGWRHPRHMDHDVPGEVPTRRRSPDPLGGSADADQGLQRCAGRGGGGSGQTLTTLNRSR